MSDKEQNNMNTHTNIVAKLKEEFVNTCKTDTSNEAKLLDILKKLRVVHGTAICEDAAQIQSLLSKSNISDDEFVKLSTNQSFLYIIHNHIRSCEKLAYQCKKGTFTPLTSDSDLQTATQNSNNNKINDNNVTEEISIKNMDTEVAPTAPSVISDNFSEISKSTVVTGGSYNNTSDYIANLTSTEAARLASDYDRSKKISKQKGGNYTNTTDYLNNLTSTEAKNMADKYDNGSSSLTDMLNKQKSNLNVNNPTLVYYWADWCGVCQRFKNTWNEFKKQAAQKYPNLQISELNIGNNKDLIKMASQVGVEGYPTLMLFNVSNKPIKKSVLVPKDKDQVSQDSIKDLDVFIKNNLNSK